MRFARCLVLLIAAAGLATADIVYDFQGTGSYAGSSFRYTAPAPVSLVFLDVSNLDSYTGIFAIPGPDVQLKQEPVSDAIGFVPSPGGIIRFFHFDPNAFTTPGVHSSIISADHTGALTVTDTGAAVPEPSSVALVGTAVAGVMFWLRARRNAARTADRGEL